VVVCAERVDAASLPRGARALRVTARGATRARRERDLAERLAAAAERAGCDATVGIRHLARVGLYWPHGGAYRVALAARRASRGRELEAEPRGRHRVFLELERALLSEGGARRVACVSALVRDELAQEHPACAERLRVVENGVDLERFHPRARETAGRALRAEIAVPDGTPLVSFPAREPRLKGLPALLEALAGLDAGPWRLLVAGVRRESGWRRRAKRLGLADRVSFVRDADPVELAAAADLTALPTWRDTSSLALLESLAAGTPVVTTARAGAATAIADPAAGTVLADPADVGALGDALAAWLDRLRSQPVDRTTVRRGSRLRDRAAWLDELATLV
jgi:glycosyltransferase involved in cell wall biosynthesis